MRAARSHNTLNDKGHVGIIDNFTHLRNRLASRVGIHRFQEREAGAVNVHGGGENVIIIQNIKLFKNSLFVPGLDGGHTDAANLDHVLNGTFHDFRVDAVAGERHHAVFIRGFNQNRVVCKVVVLGSVMHIDGAEGSHEYRGAECAAEHFKGHVGIGIRAQSIHVDTDFLPFVKVACGNIAGSFAAGAGHSVRTGTSVAHGTCFAVRADTIACSGENFIIIHVSTSCFLKILDR